MGPAQHTQDPVNAALTGAQPDQMSWVDHSRARQQVGPRCRWRVPAQPAGSGLRPCPGRKTWTSRRSWAESLRPPPQTLSPTAERAGSRSRGVIFSLCPAGKWRQGHTQQAAPSGSATDRTANQSERV